LVEKLKSSEAKLSAQAEAHEADMQELKKKVVEATKNFNVEVVKHEICEIERSRARKMLMSFVLLRKNAMIWLCNVLKI
jgi:hypothetical protein